MKIFESERLALENYVKEKTQFEENDYLYDFACILNAFKSDDYNEFGGGTVIYIKTVTDENGKILGYTVSEDVKDAEYSYRNDELDDDELESKENKYIDNAYFIDVEDDYLYNDFSYYYEIENEKIFYIKTYKIDYENGINLEDEYIINFHYEIESEEELKQKYELLDDKIFELEVLKDKEENKEVYDEKRNKIIKELKEKNLDKYIDEIGYNIYYGYAQYLVIRYSNFMKNMGKFTFGKFCESEYADVKITKIEID